MIVIYGKDVPTVKENEDIKAIALKLIHDLSGVTVHDSQVKDCHRMGPKILLSFVHAGTCSPISRIMLDKSAMHRTGTWINVHQSPFDRTLAFIARKMKRKGILEFVGTTLGALVRVGKNGQKFTIKTMEDLQKLSSEPLSSFLNGPAGAALDDSAVFMES